MSTERPTKINQLLNAQPLGIVLQSSWLSLNGYSPDLQKRYRKGKWLSSIGKGAMIRAEDKVGYEGAIYTLQKQSGLTVHPGGKTALALLGQAHYLEMSVKKVTVFGNQGEKLPTWFQQHDWGVMVDYYPSSFLPTDIGMVELEMKSFSIKVSGAARAMIECLYLVPENQPLIECYELMEGLNNIRPLQVQELLEKCQSIKVKRLFLYLAEKAEHGWLQFLDLGKIYMGHGKRSIVSNGVYVSKYKITVPKELEEYGKSNV